MRQRVWLAPTELYCHMNMAQVGKWLVVFGVGTAVLGGLLWGLSFVAPDLKLGRLPGDIVIERSGSKVFIPITTMVMASIVLTGVMWLIGALRK